MSGKIKITKSEVPLIMDIADEVAKTAYKKFFNDFEKLARKCESPIERVFLAEMVKTFQHRLWVEVSGVVVFLDSPDSWPNIDNLTGGTSVFDGALFIGPQVLVGPYRVDFLIQLNLPEARKFICVECDGHDFHERTKKQAAQGKARDRWMTTKDISVLRFTGSEIWNDAHKCVAELERMMLRMAAPELVKYRQAG